MTAITGTGALSITKSTVSGSGVRHISGSGALSVTKATTSGVAKNRHHGIGALTVSHSLVTVSAIHKKHLHAVGSLFAKKPTIESITFVPDNTIWDTDNRPWGEANFVYSEARPVMIIGNEFFQADSGTTNFGTILEGDPPTLVTKPIIVSLVRTGLAITGRDRNGNWKIDPGVVKTITGIWPIFRGNVGTVIQVSCGSQEHPDDPISWQGPRNFTIGINSFIDFDEGVTGPYLAVKFESLNQESWQLLSYDLEIEDVGSR